MTREEKYKDICKIAKDKFGLECLDDEYDTINTKMTWVDKDGYKYHLSDIQVVNIKNIKTSIFNSYNKYTVENIHNFLNVNNIKTKLLSTEYKNAKSYLKFKCECGNEFKREWYAFYKGYKGNSHYCRECINKKISKSNIVNKDIKYKEIKNKENISVISKHLFYKEYKNTKSKISVVDNDGYKYKITLHKILHRDNHSPFHKFNPYTYDNIDRYLMKNDLKCTLIRDSRKYTGNMMKLKFKCNLCGNIYKRDLSNLTNDNNNSSGYCPKCAAPISSRNNCYYNKTNANKRKFEWINKYAIVYLIKIYGLNSNEEFYKVGITSNSVRDRFSHDKIFNEKYDYEVIRIYKTNKYAAVFIEQDMLDYFFQYRYKPKFNFDGSSECFNSSLDLNKIKSKIINHNKYKKEVSHG